MLGLFDEKKEDESVATDSAADLSGESNLDHTPDNTSDTTAVRDDDTAVPTPIAAETGAPTLVNTDASIQSPTAQPYNPPASKPLI